MMHRTGKAILFFLVILSAAIAAPCQRRYDIGLEGGVGQDKYKVRDPGGNLVTTPSLGWLLGSTLRMRRPGKDVFYETGLLVKKYVAGFSLKQQTFNFSSSMDMALLLPQRLGYQLNASDQFGLMATFGLVPALKLSPADGRQGSYGDSNDYRSLDLEYTVRPIDRDLYLLFQGGLAMELQSRMFPSLKVVVAGNYYYQWLSTVTVVDVDYRINSEPDQRAYVFGRGRFVNIGLGVRYAIRNGY